MSSDDVLSMYSRYPFPGEDYLVKEHFQVNRYLTGRGDTSGVTVLDAGCGTGHSLVALCRAFPDIRITGVDFCEASLDHARRLVQEAGLEQVTLQQADLNQLELGKKFRYVFSIGVLHAIPDPLPAWQNLTRHLEDDGRMIIWLYGKYGRARLLQNQQMLQVLLQNVSDQEERTRLAARMIDEAPGRHMQCTFSTGDGRITYHSDWEVRKKWLLEREAWINDQFLHPVETPVSMTDILEVAGRCGLELEEWFGVNRSAERYVRSPELTALFDGLDERDRLQAIDLLVKPDSYMVALRKNP